MNAIYRATVYSDEAMTTVLQPTGAAPHSTDFKVATDTGVSGFQPYMKAPTGRHGRIDLQKRSTDRGQITIDLLDVRNTPGGSNASRFFTAYIGSSNGRRQLKGQMIKVEISTDGGSAWTDWYVGRVRTAKLTSAVMLRIVAEDRASDLGRPVFHVRPHPSATSLRKPALLPIGMVDTDYRGMAAVPYIQGTVKTTIFGNWLTRLWIEFDVDQFGKGNLLESANIITQTAKKLIMDGHTDDTRVWVNNLTTSNTGEVKVRKVWVASALFSGYWRLMDREGPSGVRVARGVGVEALDVSDPNYVAISANDDIECYVFSVRPRKESPWIVQNVHPMQFAQDLLDGYYGRLTSAGAVSWSVPYDSTVATLLADASLGLGTWHITEEMELYEALEELICKPHDLAYTFNASGQLSFIDLRLPNSTGGLTTIDDADVDVAASVGWVSSLDGAITEMAVTYFTEQRLPISAYLETGETYPALPPTRILSVENEFRQADLGDAVLGEEAFVIDGHGLRFFISDQADDTQLLVNKIESQIRRLIKNVRGPYADGPTTVHLVCRRTSDVLGLTVGELVLVDVDKLPNAATHQRGGVRVARVTEWSDTGLHISVTLLDMGAGTVSAVPTVGTLSLVTDEERQAMSFTVTVNGDTEPVDVEYAVTLQSVGTIPVEASALWTYSQEVLATGTVTIENLPMGSRIWIRARSFNREVDTLKLPSAWVVSTGTDFVDTQGPSAPTSVLAGSITSSTALVTWTNTDTDLNIEITLVQGADEFRVALLAPGSDEFPLYGLDASTAYTVKVRYYAQSGGVSAFGSDAFSTTASVPVCPGMFGMVVLVGAV